MSTCNILVLNGPNLNLLGSREPDKYGAISLDVIIDNLNMLAKQYNVTLTHHQSNAEHILIDIIHQMSGRSDFVLINPAAFTHTSVALRDALLAVNIPFIEIHLSNIYAREPFRHHSFFSDKAVGVISGFGAKGYELALDAAVSYLSQQIK